MSIQTKERSDLTIGQVARKFRLTLQTLYFYEDEGLIRPYRASGKRLYDQATIERLAFILDKKNLGHSLADIAVLLTQCKLMVATTQLAGTFLQPQLEAFL
jgi:DNA-binding transcriptional MerR regulator